MTIIKRGWRSAKKTFRFTFVDIPLGVLGIHQLRSGNQYIKSLWQSLRNPHCPECEQGILIRQQDEEHGGQNYYCKECGFALSAAHEDEARQEIEKRRIEKLSSTFAQMDGTEKRTFTDRHRLHARLLFLASTMVFSGFIYHIAVGTAWLPTLNWLSIAFMIWVFALKKSYRSWQVESGNLFVPGSFLHWLFNEKWIR